jgi:hypothetical protein
MERGYRRKHLAARIDAAPGERDVFAFGSVGDGGLAGGGPEVGVAEEN